MQLLVVFLDFLFLSIENYSNFNDTLYHTINEVDFCLSLIYLSTLLSYGFSYFFLDYVIFANWIGLYGIYFYMFYVNFH